MGLAGMRPLTPRQQQVVEFIVAYSKERGRAPSYREIAAHLGVASVHTVHCHVTSIERKGRIRREPYEARNLVVVPEQEEGKTST